MSTVFRFFGWLLLGLVVLVLVILLALRFQPQAFVALANKALPDTTISVERIDLSYFPLALHLQTVGVITPAQDISVDTLKASLDAGAWRSNQPFWSVATGNVLIDAKGAPEEATAGPINLSIPDLRPFLTFTRLNVKRLELTGASALTATLNAQGNDDTTSIDASLQQGANEYIIKGTLGSGAPMALSLDVTGSSASESADSNPAADTAPALTGSLVGSLDTRAGLNLAISDGAFRFGQGDALQALSTLTGALNINRAGDTLTLKDLSTRYSNPGAGLNDLPLSIDGEVRFADSSIAVDASGTAEDTRFDADIKLDNNSGAVAGTLDLKSEGLPEVVSHAPFEASQLFPASVTATFSLEGTTLDVSALDVQTPSNQLGGELTVTTQPPWTVQADLTSDRLFYPLVQNDQAAESGAESTEPSPTSSPTPSPASADAVAATAATQTPAPDSEVAEAPTDKLFSDDAIDWSWINSATIDARLTAKTLALQDAEFTDLNIALKNTDGTLVLDPLAATLGNGGFSGSTTLSLQDAEATSSPVALNTLFKLSGVSLEAFGLVPTEELSGGKVEADITLASTGNSASDLASGLAGEIVLMVEEATLMNDFVELVGSDLVMETLNKLNPFAKQDPTTELSCALVRFTAEDGKLTTNNQLVMETSKMEIVGNGTVDLGTEKISLGITPNAKSGVGVNIGSAVKFLKLGGTLAAPRPAVSAGGLLKSGLAIGAAISTGGASVVAEGLAKRALNAGSACEAVRKDRASEPQTEAAGS